MSDLKKVIIPIIRTPEQKKLQEATKGARMPEIREHQKLAKDMSVEELEERRIHFFDLWCWETGDPTHRVISEIYSAAKWLRELVSVQPMDAALSEYSLKYKYTPGEPEDDT